MRHEISNTNWITPLDVNRVEETWNILKHKLLLLEKVYVNGDINEHSIDLHSDYPMANQYLVVLLILQEAAKVSRNKTTS